MVTVGLTVGRVRQTCLGDLDLMVLIVERYDKLSFI